jgi:DNA polymerase-1
MTDFGLASRLSIPGDEAREYIKKYFERYPLVDKYLKDLIESAAKNGYSTTMFGRKRYIRELGSSNARIRSLGERYAVNTPIQGSAADIMKLSTIRLYEKLVSAGADSNIILHVHDEIVLELKEKDIDIVENIIRESMENILTLKVRLKVDINTGKNWYI